MSRVHAAFPPGTLSIDAQLKTKTRGGDNEQTYEVNIEYERVGDTLSATMLLRDAFGGALEKMVITNIGTTNLNCEYFKGENLSPAPAPDMTANIATTDFHWQDLTLSFLWWQEGTLTGAASLKNRKCHTINTRAPVANKKNSGVRLWIDAEMYAMLRAEFYDANGKTINRFDVKSFAKTKDFWMVKNIDMRTYPSGHKTTLRVRKVDRSETKTGDVLK